MEESKYENMNKEELIKVIEEKDRLLKVFENLFGFPEDLNDIYHLVGGLGIRDENNLPEYVEISPVFNSDWTQLYRKTDKTISIESS